MTKSCVRLFLCMAVLQPFASVERALAGSGVTEPPEVAKNLGYRQVTFDSNLNSDIDMADSRLPGFNWYLGRWFGWSSSRGDDLSFDDSGVRMIKGNGGANYTIGTAARTLTGTPESWVGKSFGGGGYFEAEIKFDPSHGTQRINEGFPAWWLEPIEHLMQNGDDQWPGEPVGFAHFAEIDIMEFNQAKKHGQNTYSGAVHEWFGEYNVTCPAGFCDVSNYNGMTRFNNAIIKLPDGTDLSSFHKYAIAWVPAVDSNEGYIEYYFDGKSVGDKVTWKTFGAQRAHPGKSEWTFGVIDQMHFVPILGTGSAMEMIVKSVHVWQASDKQNIFR